MANSVNTNTQMDHIKSQFHVGTKMYITYDGSSRMSTVYTAHANAVDGEGCLLTTYTYVGASTRIEKMRETVDSWAAAYDI